MRNLRIAFSLMTTLPLKPPERWSAGDSGRASAWYPFVGLIVGAITWLVWKGAIAVGPPLIAGALTLVVWVVLTGGLHLDGLADCCDSLLTSTSVERRLEIMKDPHIGAFGVIGLVLVLLLKAAVLSSLTLESSLGILLATTLARWLVLPAGLMSFARPSGMGADFAAGFRKSFIVWGAIIPLTIAILLGLPGVSAAFAGSGAAVLILWFARSRIGGMTGDVFGMIVEVVETVVLIVCLTVVG